MLNTTVETFVKRIHQDIPLTQVMGWQITDVNQHQLKSVAPLSPNINDKGTFFGGATSALMTISAWSLIKFQLEQMGLTNDVVIHKSSNQWLRPQKSQMFIESQFVVTPDWKLVKKALIEEEKNIHLKVNCIGSNDAGKTCTMKASYVVLATL